MNKETYSNKVPVIVTYEGKENKLLVPNYWLVGYLISQLRHKLLINDTEGIYLFSENKLVSASLPMDRVDYLFKKDDKYLKLVLQKENAFG